MPDWFGLPLGHKRVAGGQPRRQLRALVWIMRTSSAISPAPVTSEVLAGEPADQAGAGRTKADGPGAGPAADQGSGPLPGHADHADHADHGEDVDAAAVSAYLASVKAGKPLSERALASSFGKTSRRWARKQMAQARALQVGAAACRS